MNQEEFDIEYDRRALPPKRAWPGMRRKLKSCLIGQGLFSQICGFLPILHWLPNYQWKNNLFQDIIGGLTVGIMHVPQGMAYASLASLDPIYGLYSSFFASSFYMFFGTSRHNSVGVFAVASLMVGSVRLRLLPDITDDQLITEAFNGTTMDAEIDPSITPIQLTTALTLTVGVVQIVMGALRLDFITAYMSDQLLAGFTTGAACHVFVAQLNKMVGVKLPRYSGFGMLIYMLRDLGKALPRTNIVTAIVSICSIAFLVIGKALINPWVIKRFPIPIPFDLLLVVFGTAASFQINLHGNYHVAIVDHIPRGIPNPSLPRIDLVPTLLSDAIGIAIVCFVVT
uniref:SLC26A/SulP transporter domain-containing protein n=1 Tax=Plectus sambesii TaxID=2011161 RepID=A0A914XNE6_9BILA